MRELSQNKGLPTKFLLSGGKFLMLDGKAKVDDNMRMFLGFADFFRIYKQSYIIDALRFVQNTTTFLTRYKDIFKLKTLTSGKQFIPFAKINAVDIPINYSNRKSTSIYIEYTYNLKGVKDTQTIKTILT